MNFDFEAWAKLARDDPDEFERQRQAAIRAAIEAAPDQHRSRLEAMQSCLDLERQRASTPLGACVRMHSLMWTGFLRLRKELNGTAQATDEERREAQGIQFPAQRKAERPDPHGG